MKKFLLALSCACLATSSMMADSVTIDAKDFNYPTMTGPFGRTLQPNTQGTLAGFSVANQLALQAANSSVMRLWNNTQSYTRYFAISGNKNDYVIESIDIEFGSTESATSLMVRASDAAFSAANYYTGGYEVAVLPYTPNETVNMPIGEKYFSLINTVPFSENGAATIIDINSITINYSVASDLEEPAWVLADITNEDLKPGDIITPSLSTPAPADCQVTFSLKFGTMSIPQNEDGTFTLTYGGGTYTLTAESKVSDKYYAKEMSTQFLVGRYEAKWDLVIPTNDEYKVGDFYKPTFNTAPPTDLEVTFEVKFGSETLKPNGAGAYELTKPGSYSVTAKSETTSSYMSKTQKISFSVSGEAVSVDSILGETEGVEFFNLQGVKVVDPTPGIYVVKQGNTVRKAVVK